MTENPYSYNITVVDHILKEKYDKLLEIDHAVEEQERIDRGLVAFRAAAGPPSRQGR